MTYVKNRRGGFYFVGGVPFLSVTRVLQIIDKPALRYWFGREVYYAMLKDPGIDMNEALNAPNIVRDSAASRGSTVHTIVESYKHTREHIEGIPKPLRGYAEAFYKWVEDFNMDLVLHETSVFSYKHGYAGTLDLIVKGKKKKSPHMIIDVKTGKGIYPEAHIQLSAYRQALQEETDKPEFHDCQTAVLLLRKTGTYKYELSENIPGNFKAFLAAKTLWEFVNRKTCEKVGYKGGDQNGDQMDKG